MDVKKQIKKFNKEGNYFKALELEFAVESYTSGDVKDLTIWLAINQTGYPTFQLTSEAIQII